MEIEVLNFWNDSIAKVSMMKELWFENTYSYTYTRTSTWSLFSAETFGNMMDCDFEQKLNCQQEIKEF